MKEKDLGHIVGAESDARDAGPHSPAPSYPWTLSNRLSLFIYNWLMRPWGNLRWRFGIGEYGPWVREFREKFPNHPRGYPKAAPIDRETMEWAYSSALAHASRRFRPDGVGQGPTSTADDRRSNDMNPSPPQADQ